MKWIHKQTGWEAETAMYQDPSYGVRVRYEVGGMKTTFNLPIEILQSDENWIEMPDDRWLDFSLTAKEFMQAFAMTIDARGLSHDSLVVKSAIDKKYMMAAVQEDNE